jgi:hypothetical protein
MAETKLEGSTKNGRERAAQDDRNTASTPRSR